METGDQPDDGDGKRRHPADHGSGQQKSPNGEALHLFVSTLPKFLPARP
jgi:hypothetical protein